MKISNDKPGGTADSADPTAPVTGARTAHPGTLRPAPAGGVDEVTVSPEARLLQLATDQAASSPAIRSDVVERLRAMMADGKIGTDSAALADAIIDNWLAAPQAVK
jgi:flagellar biosynthesis anti-sigma factor FlgM